MGASGILHHRWGDNAVPNVAAFLHARALGVKQTTPAPRLVPGLETTTGGEATSALTVFDYGIDISCTVEPVPIAPNSVHDTLRVNPRALAQMDVFLSPAGVAIQPCDGACDPE
jgi:hypothetical protein